jgi:SAM-dependent methyltransferase
MESQLLADLLNEEKSHWWHRAKRALVMRQVKPQQGKALVLGAGGGAICGDLSARGYEVTAVDISEVSCGHVAREFGVTAIRHDLEQPLAIADGSFDVIIAADVLEHLENDAQLLREARRCLKPGGSLIITVPAYPGFWSSWDERLGHRRRYTSAELASRVKEAGLHINKLTFFNTLICAFVYCYRKSPFYRASASSGKSDFSLLSGSPWSSFFSAYYLLERGAISLVNMPFGLSILAVAVKHG